MFGKLNVLLGHRKRPAPARRVTPQHNPVTLGVETLEGREVPATIVPTSPFGSASGGAFGTTFGTGFGQSTGFTPTAATTGAPVGTGMTTPVGMTSVGALGSGTVGTTGFSTPGFTTPGFGTTGTITGTTTSERQLLAVIFQANVTNVLLGSLALTQSSNPAIQNLGAQLETFGFQVLTSLQRTFNINGINLSLSPFTIQSFITLSQQTGTAFDQAFLNTINQQAQHLAGIPTFL